MTDRDSPVTEDELHAYVDGEIAADRRGAVEAWLASHPEHAARVAHWRAQADAIRARYDAIASEPVSARFDLDKLARGSRSWRAVAAAAVIAAFLAGGVVGWMAVGEPIVAVACVIVADVCGAAMMTPKAYRDPYSETLATYALASLAGALAAGAVGVLDVSLLIYPIYYCLVNGALAVLIRVRRREPAW